MIQLAWLWLRYQPGSELAEWFRNRVGTLAGRTRRYDPSGREFEGDPVIGQPLTLGPVDKPDPDSNAGQQHERGKALDELVVSGGDAA